jgi:hypothetical protein
MSYSAVHHDPDVSDGVGLGMGPLADSRPDSSNNINSSTSNSRLLNGLVSRAEMLVTINTRLKNTVTCIIIYIALMILNIFVMSWELAGRGWHPVIVFIELLLTLFIVIEVALGIYGLGRAYFANWMNRVDFGLAILCVLFFILIISSSSSPNNISSSFMSELDALLLAFRFLFQVARLGTLIYRSRQAALMQTQEEIDFNNVSLEACVEEEEEEEQRRGNGGRNSRSLRDSIHDINQTHDRDNDSRTSSQVGTPASEYRRNHTNEDDDTAGGKAWSGTGGMNAALNLDSPSISRSGTSASIPSQSQLPPTSFIHLKPSIYLELQNARAFADANNSSTSVSTSMSALGGGGSALLSPSTNGALIATSGDSSSSIISNKHNRINSSSSNSILPRISASPPATNNNNAAASQQQAASGGGGSASGVNVAANGMNVRTLHPLLAHDSFDEDDLTLL